MQVLPTLSSDGFLQSNEKMLDYLLSYYITTDARQSYLFNNRLTSLPYTAALYSTDPIGFREALKSDLISLLQKYYKFVDVQAETYESKDDKLSYYIIFSVGVINEQGVKYDLNKVVSMRNTVSDKILAFSNYGLAKNYVFSKI